MEGLPHARPRLGSALVLRRFDDADAVGDEGPVLVHVARCPADGLVVDVRGEKGPLRMHDGCEQRIDAGSARANVEDGVRSVDAVGHEEVLGADGGSSAAVDTMHARTRAGRTSIQWM